VQAERAVNVNDEKFGFLAAGRDGSFSTGTMLVEVPAILRTPRTDNEVASNVKTKPKITTNDTFASCLMQMSRR